MNKENCALKLFDVKFNNTKNGFWLDSSLSALFYIIQELRHNYDCKPGL